MLCFVGCKIFWGVLLSKVKSRVGYKWYILSLKGGFLKCSKQALVSSSVDSTELFLLLPPQYNPVPTIFYL